MPYARTKTRSSAGIVIPVIIIAAVLGIVGYYFFFVGGGGLNQTISIQSIALPGGTPDTGTSYTLTVLLGPKCQVGQPCPQYVSLPALPPYTVSWRFGDGTSATGNPVVHHFPGLIQWSGCYTATATVTDQYGNTGTVSINAQSGEPTTTCG